MKEIRAYIQPFMLSKVTQALLEIPHFPGMSVSDCEGFGGEKVIDQDFTPYVPRKRIEIFAPDELVEGIFNTVMQAANTHQRGAGKIYVIDVDRSGHISMGLQKDEHEKHQP
ncbi:P-II family nitrogen regulator [Nitrosovibrio tenuis]|uniref:Nitrogen regulatory protein P-II family n=1 Tax=Nitrosovibrio tenuis TaxID=1233 RepID=A0A1H7NGK8_9PROT|nr:P-II family nitrogen regulator [Nitrosovibrio tenuis]SEL22670.1 nitrogen regulatory protein P-II family [Nitrosovibrio tenuis]